MRNVLAESVILNAQFCNSTNTRFVFEPKDLREAEFIAGELLAMGFKYYRSEDAQNLQDAVGGSLYLDGDKTIMVSSASVDDGHLCSIDNLDRFYIPENALQVEGRLSSKDVQTKKLAFYPRTGSEARSVLGVLISGGAVVDGVEQPAAVLAARAVTQGIVVDRGHIRFAPASADLQGAEICTAADLGVNAVSSLSAEQVTIMAAFNEMAARMEQMAQRIARLEGEVLPEKIEKKQPAKPAGFPTPKNGHG